MTPADIKFQAELDARANVGEMHTITSDNGITFTISQGIVDLMMELHGIDAIAEIKEALNRE